MVSVRVLQINQTNERSTCISMVRQIYYKELAHEVMEAGRFKNLQGGPVVQETREN